MYGAAIGGVTGKEVPSGVSGQRWQQQLSQRAAPWGRGHSGRHATAGTHSLGTNRFLGWPKWWGVPLGPTVYWAWTESPRRCPTGNELLMAAPLTLTLWVARAMTTPKAHLFVPPEGGSPQRSWSSPLLLPSSTCHHKAEGNQVSCRFGPARKAADWSKQN